MMGRFRSSIRRGRIPVAGDGGRDSGRGEVAAAGDFAARQRDSRLRGTRLVGEVFEVLAEGESRRENQWMGIRRVIGVLNFTSPGKELWDTTCRFG